MRCVIKTYAARLPPLAPACPARARSPGVQEVSKDAVVRTSAHPNRRPRVKETKPWNNRGESNPVAFLALAAVRADPASAAFLAPRAPAVVLADSVPAARVARIALAVVLADPVPATLSALVAPAAVEADDMFGGTHAVWYRWVARDKFEH